MKMLTNGSTKAICKCMRNTPVLKQTVIGGTPSRSMQKASNFDTAATADMPNTHQQRRRASVAYPSSEATCLRRIPRRSLAEAVKDFARVAKEHGGKLKSQLLGQTECPAQTTSYAKIPGPRGIPFLGSVLEYTAIGRFSPKEFDKALRHRHNRYGTIFREKLMNEEFVYISDPKDIRVVVQNEGKTPLRPHLEAIVRCRHQENLPVGITAMQGAEWLRNRNAINPAISPMQMVTKFRKAQSDVTDDFLSQMERTRDPKSGEITNFEQWLNRWALESIAVVLLDSRLGLLEKSEAKVNPSAEKLRECMDIFFDYGARLTFGVPTWKLFNTKDWKVFRQCQRDEFQYAGLFVDRKLKELAQKEALGGSAKSRDSNAPASLLEHVINNKSLTRDEALTVCLELLAGGIDTTASAAIFTLYHLSVNQKHQQHLRELLEQEESQGPVATGCPMKVHTTEFSKYLKACVWESLRINPLTYANMRRTSKDLVLSGYKVPKGTTVRYTSHLMNLQNDKYFPKSEEFMPSRWLDRKSEHRCTEQFTFTPFGHGARQCPGRRVAEQELDLLFRAILKNYKVEYKHGKMGTKVRLFNKADKPAQFSFVPL